MTVHYIAWIKKTVVSISKTMGDLKNKGGMTIVY